MAAPNPDPSWADFESLRHSIKGHTVDRLKHIITGLSEECRAPMSKSGKKQELIERITKQLDSYYAMRNTNHAAATEQWNHARSVLHQVRTSGVYTSRRSSLAAQHIPSSASYNVLPPSRSIMNGHQYSHNSAGPSSVGRLDPYSAQQRRPLPTPSSSISANSGLNHGLKFRPSPFFRLDQNASSPVECPGSLGSTDRRAQTLHFTLTADQSHKLTSPGSKYQLRLFCTSSSFYSPALQSSAYCPIEFPPTCEVRVNNTQISANLKGVKKKPGTAPPADIGKLVRHNGQQNKVEMVYVDSQRGNRQQGDSHHEEPPKKFYLLVSLVETTSVEQLVERLRKGKFRTAEEIRSIHAQSAMIDDDIVAGDQTMSLKCPLSYTRIQTPCRSEKCVHPQCFDATSWYSIMEQTTTWLCPVCEKVLNIEDLIIDGYFDEILQKTPDSVEEVILEPDGEWHSVDKKYGSAAWKARNPVGVLHMDSPKKSPATSPAVFTKAEPEEDSLHEEIKKSKAPMNSDSIVVVDSDDEDEGRVTRELSPTYRKITQKSTQGSITVESGRSQSVSSRGGQTSQVIDLTELSDNEDTLSQSQSHSQSTLGKRKYDDSSLLGVNPAKRTRPDHRPEPVMIPLPRRPTNGYTDAAPSSASSNGSPTYHPPPQSSRPLGASLSHVMNSSPPPPPPPPPPHLTSRNGYNPHHYPQFTGYPLPPPPANVPPYNGSWKDAPPTQQPPYQQQHYRGSNGRNWQ